MRIIRGGFWMKEKAKQLLTESSKIDELTLVFGGEVVNELQCAVLGQFAKVARASRP